MKNLEIRHSPVMPISAPCASGQPLQVGGGLFMNKVCGIYKITSPSGKIYIGQSVDCHTRKRKYKNGNANSQSRLENSIKKYGWNAHKFEIIHVCERTQLNDLEIYYIQLYQTFNSEHGLNLKAGGQYGGACSEETKRKISASRVGKKLSEQHKKNIGAAGIGRIFSKESRIKKSKSLRGIVRSEKWAEKHRKKVFRLNDVGELITYKSLTACASIERIPISALSIAINNDLPINGVLFSYSNVSFQKK